MPDCIFCEIIKGSIPSKTFFEDDEVIAFLDINPTAKGHSLIVPKNHFNLIYDPSEDKIGKVFKSVSKVSKLIRDKLECDGFNLLVNQGKLAGQEVDHFHIHIIPRYKGDGIHLFPAHIDIKDDEMKNIWNKLKE